MRNLLLAGAAALLATGSVASAADLPAPQEYMEPAPAPAVVPDWTGVYLGVHGGFGGDRFDYPFDVGPIPVGPGITIDGSAHLTSSGFFGGGQGGFNWQLGPRWVVGLEGDIAWSDIKGEVGLDAAVAPAIGSGSVEVGSEVQWFGTGRARVGFLPTDSFLAYATGGVAFGEVNSYFDINIVNGQGGTLFAASADTSDVQVGWTAGAGVEYAITDHLSFKTEYLYVDLGSQELLGPAVLGVPATLDVDTHFHTIKGGLNFRF